jgi:serine protease Do
VPTWLGIWLQDLTPQLREALGAQRSTGVLISTVYDASPAARAGVRRGDVLVAIDGAEVRSRQAYYEISRSITVGQTVALALDRAGERVRVELTAEKFPETRADEFAQVLLGLELADRNGQPGLRVARVVPRSAAEERGLRAGDVLLQIGQDRIEDRKALRRAIPKILGTDGVVIVVQRGRQFGSVMLELW